MTDTTQLNLSAYHRKELLEESAITAEVVAERGYVTVDRPLRDSADSQVIPGLGGTGVRETLKRLRFPGWAIREDYFYPGLLIPGYSPTGERYAGQWKPKAPVTNRDGKKMKYASATGCAARLDVHPRWSRDRGQTDAALLPAIQDPSMRLWITEGVKKADSLTSRGEVTVALAGVYNWRSTHGTLGEWEDVRIKDREVIVCFDADARTNPNVLRAMQRLGKWLRSKGAKVKYVLPPGHYSGRDIKGVDEFFAAGGTVRDLERYMEHKAPVEVDLTEDRFTDAYLVEVAADAVLTGSHVHTTALGWLRWTGKVWREAEEGEVLERLRLWALEEYRGAIDEQKAALARGEKADPDEIDGWHKVQSASRLSAVLKLAKGIVFADANTFDQHPDLLNTPGGVVDLRTGEVAEHDPALLLTKITEVDYDPAAEDKAFSTVLESVPADAVEWLQVHAGQAITGYSTDRLLLLTGGGGNGKTALMGTLFRALGGYAVKVPNTLLLKGKTPGGATPEVMTLRGTRLAYMEETPEDGYLDGQMAKAMLDAEEIDGRQLYQKSTSWKPTHTLFLNTNHPPIVTGTDDGTWRRLTRLVFPYRYRKPGDVLERPTDRVGDPRLKRDLDTPEARRAALAWLVAGAVTWYGNDRVAPLDPATVVEAVEKWREDSDDVLRFIRQTFEVDASRWVSSAELYSAYVEWARSNGHKVMSSRELFKRIGGHSALPAFVEKKKIRTSREGVSRPMPAFSGVRLPDLASAVEVVLGLAFAAS